MKAFKVVGVSRNISVVTERYHLVLIGQDGTVLQAVSLSLPLPKLGEVLFISDWAAHGFELIAQLEGAPRGIEMINEAWAEQLAKALNIWNGPLDTNSSDDEKKLKSWTVTELNRECDRKFLRTCGIVDEGHS